MSPDATGEAGGWHGGKEWRRSRRQHQDTVTGPAGRKDQP